MATSSDCNKYEDDDDDDVKIVLPEPASSTSTQLLDAMGNKIGEVNLNTYDTTFQYATESYPSITDRITWGEQDTNLLLKRYERYISEVGPRKRFHSKKYMWNQIANDIYEKYKLIITGVQCENRYKTVCKRKKMLPENNLKPNNKPTPEEKSIVLEDLGEAETTKNGEQPQSLEKLEHRNQELIQQIEQCNTRFLTLVDKLEKNHGQQQQRLEKSIQKNREQHKVEFSALIEKLEKVNETIKQTQQQQQETLEKLIKEDQDQHKTEFTALMNVLEKIHESIEHGFQTTQNNHCSCIVNRGKPEDIKRLRSRSPSSQRNSSTRRSHTPTRKRRYSSRSRSPSTSKCRHKSPISSHSWRRSRSKDINYKESHQPGVKNNQYPPIRSSNFSRHDQKHNSKSRSPNQNHRKSFPESCHKHRDQWR